jgi:hypothetical protein
MRVRSSTLAIAIPRGTRDGELLVARLRPTETGRGFPLERLFLPRHVDVRVIGGGHQCISDFDDPLLDLVLDFYLDPMSALPRMKVL